MGNTAANVLVGKPAVAGGIWRAPLGTELPTDSTSSLDPAFEPAGYVSDNGVTQSIGADTQKIKAWGGDTVRVVQTSHELTYKFALLETNDVATSIYYGGDNVNSGVTKIKAGDLPHEVYVVEIFDAAVEKKIRIVVADGQVTDREDIVYKDDEAIMYGVTIEAYPSAELGDTADETDVKALIYQDDDES